MSCSYHIYSNTGAGDPIDYASPVATVGTLNWTSAALAYPGTWSFGVRAFDTVSGLEEQNLDCAVTLVLNATGDDVTNTPAPPSGLRAFALAGGSIQAEWYYAPASSTNAPTGFHVYAGAGELPDYTSPAATVLFAAALGNSFTATLTGFSGGIAYTIAVRAFNGINEEANTNTVTVTALTSGPAAVDFLAAVATSG